MSGYAVAQIDGLDGSVRRVQAAVGLHVGIATFGVERAAHRWALGSDEHDDSGA